MSEDYEIMPTVLVIHPSGYTEFIDENKISSFDNEEDIENVFETIDAITGMLRRETDDDGRYDPWS